MSHLVGTDNQTEQNGWGDNLEASSVINTGIMDDDGEASR